LKDYTDKELLQLFLNSGERNHAFNLIVKKYQEKLYWHIRKLLISHDDTDDVLQNTMINAYFGLENFREDASLYTWLYRIATNEALSAIKKKKRRMLLNLEDVRSQLEKTLKEDVYCSGDDIQIKLQKAILTLPDKQRLVFNMKYFDEMKYEDISEILDTSVGALKASYHHAVKKIEKYLKED
jgi:RNA polymerase sigma-70 factor (ECF subfamily)